MVAYLRLYRRFVVRNFGGTRNCLTFFLALFVTLFVMDRLLFAKQRQPFPLSGKSHSNLADVSPSIMRSEQPLPPVVVNPKAPEEEEKPIEPKKPIEAKTQKPVESASTKCGPTVACPDGKYTYYVKSGVGRDGLPTVCFNGKQIISPEKKNADRGFNIVVINDKTLEVEDVRTFDVYVSDGVMSRYLKLGIQDGHLVIVATLDEASYNLQDQTKAFMKHFGSNLVEKIKFRDTFVMVGQKGLTAGSAIEKIQFAGTGWPKPISKILCVPTVLTGIPSTVSSANNKRLMFCRKTRDNGPFCIDENADMQITPAVLNDKSLENHEIFTVPIVVIPGPTECSFNDLRMTLEGLMLIPGLNRKMVTVFFTEATTECRDFADIFDFKTVKLSVNTTTYEAFMRAAMEKAWSAHSSADHLVVLEENVIPSPDLLSFFAQCLPLLGSDDSLIGVTAWNENGYEGVSTRPDLVYRTETFPGLGFLLKRKFYNDFMNGKMAECCSKRSWEGWLFGKLSEKEMIVPDVSRAFRNELKKSKVTKELFGRRRVTSLESSAKLSDVSLLVRSKYEEEVQRLIQTSIPLDTKDSAKCLSGEGLGFTISESVESKVYSIYYEQKEAKDETTLSLLCKCFQLFYVKDEPVRGTHRGLIRFSYRKNIVFLIGSSTEYYKHKPSDLKPVSVYNITKLN